MPNSCTCLNYHIIFSTKDRYPFLEARHTERLYAYIGGVIRDLRGALLAAGGMPDHVHLLASLHPATSISDTLRQLKSGSSSWIHDTWPELRKFAWQDGYAAFSVSASAIDDVRAYVAGQAEHHRTRTFQDELRAFLSRHGIAF